MKPLALILVALIAVSACGRKGDPVPPASPTAEEQAPLPTG